MLVTGGLPEPLRARTRQAWREAAGRWKDVVLEERVDAGEASMCALLRAGATQVVQLTGDVAGGQVRWRADVSARGERLPEVRSISVEGDTSTRGVADATGRVLMQALRPRALPAEQLYATAATESWGAWIRYATARVALDEGRVRAADSLLSESLRLDPGFTVARVWAGMVRSWLSDETPTLVATTVALDSVLRHASAPPAERAAALGAAALEAGAYDASCAAWDEALRLAPVAAVAHLGRGDCVRFDDRVVRGANGALQFAASYAEAMRHYPRALELCRDELCAIAFSRIDRVVPDMPQIRHGNRLDRGEAVAALQELRGDSLAHAPILVRDIQRAARGSIPSTLGQALGWARARRVELLAVWLRRDPERAEAHAAMSRALELRGMLASSNQGEPSALAENRLARRYARGPVMALDGALERARLLLRASAFDSVVALADSLLAERRRAPTMVPPSRELAGLLAAIGRGSEASEVLAEVWGRDELRRERGTAMPAELLRPASLFLVLAALGVCGDTLARLEQRVRDLVAVRVPESDRAAVLSQSLVAPLKLSAHCDRFRPARRAGETDDPLLPLQRLAADGRFGAVQKRLEELAAERRAVAVADVSVDQSVQEALLLVATGDSASARARLVAALDGVSSSSSFTLSEVAQAAALGMGRLLLADLARGASPPTAARARAELRTLWREGEGTKRP